MTTKSKQVRPVGSVPAGQRAAEQVFAGEIAPSAATNKLIGDWGVSDDFAAMVSRAMAKRNAKGGV